MAAVVAEDRPAAAAAAEDALAVPDNFFGLDDVDDDATMTSRDRAASASLDTSSLSLPDTQYTDLLRDAEDPAPDL